jgi:ABC-type multidrug transport system fused ATPase/permease subunit
LIKEANEAESRRAFRPLKFVSTAQMSLDARAVFGNPRLNTFHLIGDLAVIVVGIALAMAGYTIGSLIAIIGVLFLLFSQVEPIQRWLVMRRYGSLLGRPVTVEIDENGLRFTNDLLASQVPWSTLTAVRANERTVVFLRERAMLGYIPASAFSSDEERLEFVRYARDHVAGEPRVSRG